MTVKAHGVPARMGHGMVMAADHTSADESDSRVAD
jgi:hypothetical protein